MLLVKFFFNLFLLMKMKHSKNKIKACTILITLLLSDIGLKNIFFAALSVLRCPLDSFIQLCGLDVRVLSLVEEGYRRDKGISLKASGHQ
jgi:hypothetical protein